MNYRHVYMLIVEHAKSEMKSGLRPKNQRDKKNFQSQYFEMHHVLPRSLYPNWVKRKSNIVALTAREHFFCHKLLTKIYPCDKMEYALFAFFMIQSNGERQISLRDYENLRILASKKASIEAKNHKFYRGEEHYAFGKTLEERVGKTQAEIIKRKMSLSHKGQTVSEENRNKLSLLLKGKSFEEMYGEEKAKEMKEKLRNVKHDWDVNVSDESILKRKINSPRCIHVLDKQTNITYYSLRDLEKVFKVDRHKISEQLKQGNMTLDNGHVLTRIK